MQKGRITVIMKFLRIFLLWHLSGKKWEYLFVDVEEILKESFVNVPEKYILC